jgi:rhomboid protease GluP
MVELYDRNQSAIAKLAPAANRDFCRLILFAFSGRRDLVERILDGPLRLLPKASQLFWLATTDLAAGDTTGARQKLERQIQSADPATRRAIERRLSTPLPTAAALDRAHCQIIEEAAREQGQEEIFHATPPLFSSASRATQILIAANFAMFALEVYLGGATNGEVLMRLGAMYPPAVRAGEWWRLGAALFLHFGALHVCMNMIGLWALGPFVEFALGFFRYLFLYLAAGVASMFVVMKFGSGPFGHHTTVGASGSIMALVGATGGLLLKGWIQQRAQPARRRLQAVITILAMQTVFDAVIPQVSMTAHLSGALFGFVLALIIPNKLISSS